MNTTRTIAPRDWQAMSWHQRQRWMTRYARDHRPPDVTYENHRHDLSEVVAEFDADPDATGAEIAERTGYSNTSPLYRFLHRNGRADVVEQLKANALTLDDDMTAEAKRRRETGQTIRDIAAALDIAPSTVIRALDRNRKAA